MEHDNPLEMDQVISASDAKVGFQHFSTHKPKDGYSAS